MFFKDCHWKEIICTDPFLKKMFCFHEIVIYKQQNVNSYTDALISAMVTCKRKETHLKCVMSFSAMDEVPTLCNR